MHVCACMTVMLTCTYTCACINKNKSSLKNIKLTPEGLLRFGWKAVCEGWVGEAFWSHVAEIAWTEELC